MVTGAGDETLRFWSVFPGPKNKDGSRLGAGLLLFSRTLAWLGAALALLLHVPLSFAGFFNFASLAFAVLYLLILLRCCLDRFLRAVPIPPHQR